MNANDVSLSGWLADWEYASLFAPADKRNTLAALYQFTDEIFKIPYHVSDPTLLAIRQAWWREALAEMVAGKPARGHPVLQALSAHIPHKFLRLAHPRLLNVIDKISIFSQVDNFVDAGDYFSLSQELLMELPLLALDWLEVGPENQEYSTLLSQSWALHFAAYHLARMQVGRDNEKGRHNRASFTGAAPTDRLDWRLQRWAYPREYVQDNAPHPKTALLRDLQHHQAVLAPQLNRLPRDLMPIAAAAGLVPFWLSLAEKMQIWEQQWESPQQSRENMSQAPIIAFAKFKRQLILLRIVLTGRF
ncbi:MAG: squalene/phytoene synthase family protein [bacterium]